MPVLARAKAPVDEGTRERVEHGRRQPTFDDIPTDGDLDLTETPQTGQHVIGSVDYRVEDEDHERGCIAAGPVGGSDAGANGGEVVTPVDVEVSVQRHEAVERIAAANEEEAGDRTGGSPIAIVERMDGDELQVSQRCKDGRGELGLPSRPADEVAHQLGHVAGRRLDEDDLPVGACHAVLTAPILARSEQIALAVQHTPVDLPDECLIQLRVRAAGSKLIHELERRSRPQHLERVLAGQCPASDPTKQAIDLQVGEGVALDPRRPVHRSNPCAAAQPIAVHRVEGQIGEEPASTFDSVEGPGQDLIVVGDVHDSLSDDRTVAHSFTGGRMRRDSIRGERVAQALPLALNAPVGLARGAWRPIPAVRRNDPAGPVRSRTSRATDCPRT